MIGIGPGSRPGPKGPDTRPDSPASRGRHNAVASGVFTATGRIRTQIAQTTLRKVVGQHTLDQTLAETDTINLDIRQILDATTTEWGWR
jgi:hypothetical protein